jgi:adenylate kinase family enzyme
MKKGASNEGVTREGLGAKLKESMTAGKIPENSWMISLIGMAIKEVNETKAGWILLNFPRNSDQALLLEKELTG